MMGANDLGANVQAESQAISTRGHGMAPERLENLSQTLRWDGLTGIPHLEHQVMLIGGCADLDRAIGQSMGQCVSQEIGGHLLESAQITPHRAVDTDTREDLAVRLRILQFLNHRCQTRVDVLDVRQFDAYSAPEPSAREVEYIVNQ